MTATQPVKKIYTFDEYLALEEAESIRYEYWDGEVFAMGGTTKRHNTLVQNISFVLRSFAKRNGCQVYSENVRQKLRTGNRYVYPDVIYTCDEADLANDLGIIVNSPSLLIEVLPGSTEKTDVHDKRPHYTKIPSLFYYLLVSQKSYRVEVFERSVDFWKYRLIEDLDASVDLPLLNMTLSMEEIYDGIMLPLD